MKKFIKFGFLSISLFLFFLTSAMALKEDEIKMPYFLKDSLQMVVVITPSWNSPNGKLQRFARKDIDSPWTPVGKKASVVVGKSGLGWSGEYREFRLPGPYKIEGDYKAPAGAFILGPAFGFEKKPQDKIKLFYLPIVKTTVCVDDPNSKFYGRIIDSAKAARKDWRTAEKMIDYPGYKFGVMIDYNMGERLSSNVGSCIFMHVIDNRDKDGTRGCTAIPEQPMLNLLNWLDPHENPVLVQMPKLQYQHLIETWNLPKLSS